MSKKILSFFGCAFLLFFSSADVSAQAFRKGSLLISLSEGGTYAHYSTSGIANDGHSTTDVHGDRDPLTIEYGLTDKWGIGINIGTDIYNTGCAALRNQNYNRKGAGIHV